MARFKRKKRKDRFFRGVKKRPVKYITILPSLVTILNGVCGFAAIAIASGATIAKTSWSPFTVASYLIFLGMVADMLDGHLARMSQSTSSFGGQLDSLCDVISFGIAPAFVMLKLLNNQLVDAQLAQESVVIRFLWLCALIYMCCAIIRLARFNVENEKSDSDHSGFTGLPTPAAAGVIMSLVMFQQETVPELKILLVALPFVTLGAGFLMVSRIQYHHVVNHYLRGKKPFSYLLKILFGLGLVVVVKLPAALSLAFCAFAFVSPIKALYSQVSKKWSHDPETIVSETVPDNRPA